MIEIRDARMADSKRLAKTMETYPYLVIVRDGEIAGYAYAGPFNLREAYQWSCERIHTSGAEVWAKSSTRPWKRRCGKWGYACIAYPQEADEYLTTNSDDYHTHLGYQQVGVPTSLAAGMTWFGWKRS